MPAAGTGLVESQQNVSDQDILRLANHAKNIVGLHNSCPNLVSDAEAAAALLAAHTACSARAQAGVLAAFAALEHKIDVVDFNSRARNRNLHATNVDSRLRALKKQTAGGAAQVGDTPPLQGDRDGFYPTTPLQLRSLTDATLDQLATFYSEDFGTPGVTALQTRREMFDEFIGANP